jgi:gamma-glutamyltranspeptidase / glutathione hydrolase
MKASWIEGTGKTTGRPTVMGTRGMVSSGNSLASQAGLRVLMDGGNVVDAAIAASAVLSVVRPHMTGIGGDLLCLIYLAREGRVVAINSSGQAPKAATIDYFRSHGHSYVPMDGILSVETPGCVAGWDAALKQFGTMSVSDLLQPAIDYAENGTPVTINLSRVIEESVGSFSRLPGWMETFTDGGRPLRPGELLKQPKLGRSLRAIKEGGADAFYRGEVAEALVSFMEKEDGLLAREDLAACRPEVLDPIQIDYRGYTIYEQPPISQGHLLLQELAIAEGFDLASMGAQSADAIHVMVEAKKLAFADRLRYLGDPSFVDVPMSRLLSKEYAAKRRKSINPSRAIVAAAPGALAAMGTDTTYHCVMDAEGNAVSMIQSLFKPFGSGVVAGETGMVLNNRLAAFFLEPTHPNALAPGKKTIHTLNTYMVFKDGRPYVVGGTPGADDQVQASFQVLTNLLDFGMSLQESIEAPRWSSTPGTSPGETTAPYELRLEDRFPAEVVESLRKRGHTVKMTGPWSIASMKAVMMDPETGVLYGAADPRRDGYSAGW